MQKTPFIREERVPQLYDRSETERDEYIEKAGKEHQEFCQICSAFLVFSFSLSRLNPPAEEVSFCIIT
jgi:hypothetical protein